MPVLNAGIMPAGGTNSPGQELVNTVRRIFTPSLFVQIGKASPTLSLLMRSAKVARGGASPVSFSLQTTGMVSGNWADYLGTFPAPQPIPGINANAEFPQCMFLMPIPFLFTERAITEKAKIVDILAARMSDARRFFIDSISGGLTIGGTAYSTGLFAANNGTYPLAISTLADAYDDDSNVTTYGNVSRSTFPVWRASYLASAGALDTRKAMFAKIVQVTTAGIGNCTVANGGPGGGGEAPDIVIMSSGDWVTLQQDFQTAEVYQITPGSQFGKDQYINSGFDALRLGQTQIFYDQYCPSGTAYFINSKYLALFLNELAAFAFTGWEPTIAVNQLGWVGVIACLMTLACAMPRSGAQITGITGAAF